MARMDIEVEKFFVVHSISSHCNFSTKLSFFLSYLNSCGGLFSHHVTFYSFKFMFKIPTWVVCVNGKHPLFAIFRI